MLQRLVIRLLGFSVMAIIGIGCVFQESWAAQYKVLVVMSYEEDFLWCQQVKEGIDSVFEDQAEIRYVYMDAKKDEKGATQKAQEAFAIFQEFQPNGVITVDDAAQSLFVAPYLKENLTVPLMFCGIGAEPQEYGYPTAMISGVLERGHYRETVAFGQQLLPDAKTVCFLQRNTRSGQFTQRIFEEQGPYSLEYVGAMLPNTIEETYTMLEDIKGKCDLLVLGTLEGMPDAQGVATTDKEILPKVGKLFGKPMVAANEWQLRTDGVLSAVVKTGQEQGDLSAKMLLKALQGTPVSDIPITQNHNGKRMLNVATMKAFGITPPPAVLRGAELVTTEP